MLAASKTQVVLKSQQKSAGAPAHDEKLGIAHALPNMLGVEYAVDVAATKIAVTKYIEIRPMFPQICFLLLILCSATRCLCQMFLPDAG